MAPPDRRSTIAILVCAVAVVYGWALASVQRSTTARAMVWMDADVGDQYRFPSRPIPTGETESPLLSGADLDLDDSMADVIDDDDFDRFLRTNDTLGFVVAYEDRLVYERYFRGSGPRHAADVVLGCEVDPVNGHRASRSTTGAIDSIEDPVTDYVPELAERDPRFERITLRDLLTMSSGLRYEEAGAPRCHGGTTSRPTTASTCGRRRSRKRVIEGPPGEIWHYNNYNPLLLGLGGGTGDLRMSVSEYVATTAVGTARRGAGRSRGASIPQESGFEKMESGLNATAVDYARFGAAIAQSRGVERHSDRV